MQQLSISGHLFNVNIRIWDMTIYRLRRWVIVTGSLAVRVPFAAGEQQLPPYLVGLIRFFI